MHNPMNSISSRYARFAREGRAGWRYRGRSDMSPVIFAELSEAPMRNTELRHGEGTEECSRVRDGCCLIIFRNNKSAARIRDGDSARVSRALKHAYMESFRKWKACGTKMMVGHARVVECSALLTTFETLYRRCLMKSTLNSNLRHKTLTQLCII